MDEERAAHLDSVLIDGRERAESSVVDHDDRWPARFRETAERIRRALGERAPGVEHIGSTGVPGLAAEPVVDVLPTMVRTPARDVHVHVHELTWEDMNESADAESEVVSVVLARARAWRADVATG